MNTNNLPALVMLTAGFVDCVIAIWTRQSLLDFTKQLLVVLIIFYILGAIVKSILDKHMGEPDDFEEVDLGDALESFDDEDEMMDLDGDWQEMNEEEETQE